MKLYYWFKFWMRDIAIVRSELGTILGFTNEIGWLTLLALNSGVRITTFGILYFCIGGFIVMGLIGRFFRKKKIPEITNTLQNEMNKELQIIIKDISLIKERLGIK